MIELRRRQQNHALDAARVLNHSLIGDAEPKIDSTSESDISRR